MFDCRIRKKHGRIELLFTIEIANALNKRIEVSKNDINGSTVTRGDIFVRFFKKYNCENTHQLEKLLLKRLNEKGVELQEENDKPENFANIPQLRPQTISHNNNQFMSNNNETNKTKKLCEKRNDNNNNNGDDDGDDDDDISGTTASTGNNNRNIDTESMNAKNALNNIKNDIHSQIMSTSVTRDIAKQLPQILSIESINGSNILNNNKNLNKVNNCFANDNINISQNVNNVNNNNMDDNIRNIRKRGIGSIIFQNSNNKYGNPFLNTSQNQMNNQQNININNNNNNNNNNNSRIININGVNNMHNIANPFVNPLSRVTSNINGRNMNGVTILSNGPPSKRQKLTTNNNIFNNSKNNMNTNSLQFQLSMNPSLVITTNNSQLTMEQLYTNIKLLSISYIIIIYCTSIINLHPLLMYNHQMITI